MRSQSFVESSAIFVFCSETGGPLDTRNVTRGTAAWRWFASTRGERMPSRTTRAKGFSEAPPSVGGGEAAAEHQGEYAEDPFA
jgi:hypothetical protein